MTLVSSHDCGLFAHSLSIRASKQIRPQVFCFVQHVPISLSLPLYVFHKENCKTNSGKLRFTPRVPPLQTNLVFSIDDLISHPDANSYYVGSQCTWHLSLFLIFSGTGASLIPFHESTRPSFFGTHLSPSPADLYPGPIVTIQSLLHRPGSG